MVLRELADHYLIRSDQRGATTWYELAHDRLIGPLCADNRAWRYRHLDTFEISALEWDKAGRSDTYLLGPVRLGAAMASLSDQRDASSLLREYVEASEEWARDQLRKRRREQLIGAFGIATVILGLVVIVETVFLLVLLLS